MHEEEAPVKIGDELDVTIESVGAKGDGVAKVDGFVLFIAGAQQGERVKVQVTKVLRKVGFADIVGKSESAGTAKDTPKPEPEPEDTENFGEE
jgi:predicted RNA-binding protein with TRAM domain